MEQLVVITIITAAIITPCLSPGNNELISKFRYSFENSFEKLGRIEMRANSGGRERGTEPDTPGNVLPFFLVLVFDLGYRFPPTTDQCPPVPNATIEVTSNNK